MTIFKKILATLGLTIIIATTGIVATQAADSGGVGVDQLLYKFNTSNGDSSKVALVKGLPSGDQQKILVDVIKFVLSITGSLALASFTVAGVLFLTAQGQEEKLTKAKHLLLWSIAALAIIAVSYAVVLGISQLQFFGGASAPPNAPATGQGTPAPTPPKK